MPVSTEFLMLNGFAGYGWASSGTRIFEALAVTCGFALLARALRGVDQSGMMAGGAACLLLLAGLGPAGFVVLATLFFLTWVSTRFGYRRKQSLGIAERGEGRNAWQVLANLTVPALGSAAFAVSGNRAWALAAMAALAEAATDTVASEVGQSRSQTALLITTWKAVPAGTDGGISILGTAAGVVAGGVIAVTAAAGGVIGWGSLWIAVVAGVAGMLADSLLGAMLQRRGMMSNEAVNFFSTVVAAGLSCLLLANG